MSMKLAGRPLLDPDWLANDLIPFLRYAFSDSHPYDYSYMPHIWRAINLSYHDANEPVATILQPRHPSKEDEIQEFERVYMAVMHRHRNWCPEMAKLVRDIDALVRFLVQKAMKWGSFGLMGQSDKGSDQWVESEAKRKEKAMDDRRTASSFIAPTVSAPMPNPPPTETDIDPRLLGARPGDFTSSNIPGTLTAFEDKAYREAYGITERARLYRPSTPQYWDQQLRAAVSPLIVDHFEHATTPYLPPLQRCAYDLHPPAHCQSDDAPLLLQGQSGYHQLRDSTPKQPDAQESFQEPTHHVSAQGQLEQSLPTLTKDIHDVVQLSHKYGYLIPPQDSPFWGSLSEFHALDQQYAGYRPATQYRPSPGSPVYQSPWWSRPQNPQQSPVPPNIPPQIASNQNPRSSALAFQNERHEGFPSKAYQRGAEMVARYMAEKRLNGPVSNQNQVQEFPPIPAHSPSHFPTSGYSILSPPRQPATPDQTGKVREEQEAPRRITASQKSFATSTSFEQPPPLFADHQHPHLQAGSYVVQETTLSPFRHSPLTVADQPPSSQHVQKTQLSNQPAFLAQRGYQGGYNSLIDGHQGGSTKAGIDHTSSNHTYLDLNNYQFPNPPPIPTPNSAFITPTAQMYPTVQSTGPMYQAPPPIISSMPTGPCMLKWQLNSTPSAMTRTPSGIPTTEPVFTSNKPSTSDQNASSSMPKTGAQGTRRRSLNVCIACRRRKIRCDLGVFATSYDPPCERCRREGLECVFEKRE